MGHSAPPPTERRSLTLTASVLTSPHYFGPLGAARRAARTRTAKHLEKHGSDGRTHARVDAEEHAIHTPRGTRSSGQTPRDTPAASGGAADPEDSDDDFWVPKKSQTEQAEAVKQQQKPVTTAVDLSAYLVRAY